MRTLTVLLSILGFGIIFLSCESTNEPKFERKLVINGQLNAGNPIDSIFVSWTEDITERFNDSWAEGATVTINGVQLSEYSNFKGAFYYPDTTYRVLAGQTYSLEAAADGERVTSETTIPQTFQFTPIGVQNGDTVEFVPGDSWVSDAFFTLEWPSYNDPDVEIYRITSLADTAAAANFIDDDRNIADILKGKIEDRENPTVWWASNDTKYARINWMYFNWTGWHSIIVSAMDHNYYHYKQGILFGEQRPGEEYNQVVNGGYGLFCSSASDTIRVFVVEAP
jgi:hypothetical protein